MILEPRNNLPVITEGLFVTQNVCIGFWFCIPRRLFHSNKKQPAKSQPCTIQPIQSYWQLHTTPILFSMGPNNMQVHQSNKDNARTRIKPLTLDYSLRLKCKPFTCQVAHCTKRDPRKVCKSLSWHETISGEEIASRQHV